MAKHEIKAYVTTQFKHAVAKAVAWVIEVLKLDELESDEHTGEGMFLRIEGEEEGECRDVAPDTADSLVDHDIIEFCPKCKVFHLADGVTWKALTAQIQSLMN